MRMKCHGRTLLALGWLAAAVMPTRAEESTWIAAPRRVQLNQDPTLIPRGKGLLFVPAMTSPRNEPAYQVFQHNTKIASGNPGTGVLLPPGFYAVLIGSGTTVQMMKKTVQVVEGSTTLLNPDWAGLVINAIDESRTSVNESYELFEEESQENYGIGFGIEEERGERVRTWLLKPGVYHVVNVGETFSTTRKFSVRLLPGELTQRNLVVDSESNRFSGFYPPSLQAGPSRMFQNWNTQWELSGSTLFNTSQRTVRDLSSMSVSAQVHNRSLYNTDRNYVSLRLIFEEGVTKEGSDAFRKAIDKFELRATYIYRLSRRIGPYLRGVLDTKLFATEARFDAPRDFVKLDASETDTLFIEPGKTEVTLSPSFYPLQLRQGVGINSQLYRSFPLNVDLRLGAGARQTYVSDSFQLNADQQSATKLVTATSRGLEALLIMDARLARFVLGVGHRQVSMDRALAKGAVDEATLDLMAAVPEADLVVLATNVGKISEQAEAVLPAMKQGAILTDVGSVKSSLCRKMVRLLAESPHAGVRFVGAHPLAGSEQRGINAARRDLFRNARCILTPTSHTDAEALTKVRALWQAVGCRIIELPPEQHDQLIAEMSHLPHAVAACLVNDISDEALDLAATGFMDTTRVASGDPGLWLDICMANRGAISTALRALAGELGQLAEQLDAEERDKILDLLRRAKARRDGRIAAGESTAQP